MKEVGRGRRDLKKKKRPLKELLSLGVGVMN